MKRGDLEECIKALEFIDPEELKETGSRWNSSSQCYSPIIRRLRIKDGMKALLALLEAYEKYLRSTPIYLHARAM